MATDVDAPATRTAKIDPLQPLSTATRPLAVLVICLLLVSVLSGLRSGNFLSPGGDDVCVNVSAGYEVPMTSLDSTSDSGMAAWIKGNWDLRPRVSPSDATYQLCQARPSAVTRILSDLTTVPELVLLMGFLASVFLLVRRARRSGLFSRPVARVVHWLGWYVLGGFLVVWTVQALAYSGLVRQMLTSHHVQDFTSYWHPSVTALLAGAGILTIARMLRLSVMMQEDLDGTI